MHTRTAREIERASGFDLDRWAASHGWKGVGIGPVSRCRNSESLARSNFDVIVDDLARRFHGDVATARFTHWALGWVDEITWNTGNAELVEAVRHWRLALNDYAVGDEQHYAMTQWETAHPGDGCCHSDDGSDCCCELPHICE